MSAIKLYSWNVNGIRAVLRKESLLPWIKQADPDILCIQETKMGAEPTPVDLPGYHQFWNNATKPGYSGTAIFSKEKPLNVISGFPTEFSKKYNFVDAPTRDAANEGRVLTAEFEQFYIVTVYTPNSKDDLSRIPLRHEHWDPAFLAYCQELEAKKPVVFCGDLNVAHTPDDLARAKENEGKKGFTLEEREGFENYLKAGFVDTLRMFKQGPGFYTYWTQWGGARARNVGWRIDYFMASGALKDKVVSADIHPDVMGSDHCPISLVLDV
jgi:exodeoxyribonuclease-3